MAIAVHAPVIRISDRDTGKRPNCWMPKRQKSDIEIMPRKQQATPMAVLFRRLRMIGRNLWPCRQPAKRKRLTAIGDKKTNIRAVKLSAALISGLVRTTQTGSTETQTTNT